MFESASGGGSSFQGAQRAPWRVLLADDDAGVRNSLAALLHLDGFATEEVGGGEEALRRLRSCSPSDHDDLRLGRLARARDDDARARSRANARKRPRASLPRRRAATCAH